MRSAACENEYRKSHIRVVVSRRPIGLAGRDQTKWQIRGGVLTLRRTLQDDKWQMRVSRDLSAVEVDGIVRNDNSAHEQLLRSRDDEIGRVRGADVL